MTKVCHSDLENTQKLPGRGISQTSGQSESKGGVLRLEQLENTHSGGRDGPGSM